MIKKDFLFIIKTLKSHINVQFCGKIGGISVERKKDSATVQVSKLLLAKILYLFLRNLTFVQD